MKIAFLGDILFSGKYDCTRDGLNMVLDRLACFQPIFAQCDYVVGNLEAPFTQSRTTNEHKTLPLKNDPANIQLLLKLGINVVTLANNHIYDYGERGLNDTLEILEANGIAYCGIDKKSLTFTKGYESVSIGAFCCYTTNAWHYDATDKNGRLNTLTPHSVDAFLASARVKNSYPVLCFHWGDENTHYPKYEHWQYSQKLLDTQSATIIGHHPHVIQGIRSYQLGTAIYSLGNFCFDDCKSTRFGVEVRQTEENRKGCLCLLDVSFQKTPKIQIIAFAEKFGKCFLTDEFTDEITLYSCALETAAIPERYEQMRKSEMLSARDKRMNRRDLRWLLRHLNLPSVMAVLQRRSNSAHFREFFR